VLATSALSLVAFAGVAFAGVAFAGVAFAAFFAAAGAAFFAAAGAAFFAAAGAAFFAAAGAACVEMLRDPNAPITMHPTMNFRPNIKNEVSRVRAGVQDVLLTEPCYAQSVYKENRVIELQPCLGA
jgi:hypothetical protein